MGRDGVLWLLARRGGEDEDGVSEAGAGEVRGRLVMKCEPVTGAGGDWLVPWRAARLCALSRLVGMRRMLMFVIGN